MRIACEPFIHAGRYRLAKLIEQNGDDLVLPELLARITAECPKRQDWRKAGAYQAGYPDLILCRA